MSASDQVRLALVGCGQISRLHAQRVQADGRARWSVLFDPNLEAAARMRTEFAPAAHISPTFEDVLTRTDIDAVVISTPTHLHFEQVRACRERGWPVLCEKPLAETRERIEQLIADAEAGGPLLSVAYQRRGQSAYRTLRREVQSGRWGRVLAVSSHNCEHWEQLQALPDTWRNDPRQNPGGYIGDAGSHKLDIIFFITGLRPEEVFAHSSQSQRQVEIITTVSAKLTGGVPLGMTFLGNAHHFAEYLHIICERADFKLYDNQILISRGNVTEPITDLEPESNPISAFLDCLLDAAPNIAPADCARPVFQFTQAVLQSAKTGIAVAIGTSESG
ncbi:MAG: oxidoreductase [Planctomycetaceae bacterium]|nr:oxidoreductase [Planctomycetaceae bacterium]